MCIKGNVHDSVKGKLQVPYVWLVFISIRLYTWRLYPSKKSGFVFLGMHMLHNLGLGIQILMTYQFQNVITKLCIVLHLEMTMILGGYLGKT